MNIFETMTVRPAQMPIVERELWHRSAWSAEQHELSLLVGMDESVVDELVLDAAVGISH